MNENGEGLVFRGGLYGGVPTPRQKAELEDALADTRSAGWLVIPPGTDRGALADAVEAVTVLQLVGERPGDADAVRRARDRIADLIRRADLMPVVDEWGNVVGHRFREAP